MHDPPSYFPLAYTRIYSSTRSATSNILGIWNTSNAKTPKVSTRVKPPSTLTMTSFLACFSPTVCATSRMESTPVITYVRRILNYHLKTAL